MSDNTQGQAAPSPEVAPAIAQAEEINAKVDAEQNQEQSEENNPQEAVAAEVEAVLDDPKASKKEKEAAKKQLRKLKLKVDGKEIVEEYDPDDEEYMTKTLQMAKLGQKRASEKAQLEKEVASFIEQLKKNPRKVLEDPTIGVDVKALVEAYIDEQIENSKKSPEQIKHEQMESELKALKEEREREKEDARHRDFERLQQTELERYDMLMTKALETHKDLPKSPYIVKKMADYMLLGLDNGIDLTPEDVIPLVREEMQEDLKQMFAAMPEEVIESVIGKDVLGRMRKKNLAKAKAAPATPTAKQGIDTGDGKRSEQEPFKKKTIKEMWGV